MYAKCLIYITLILLINDHQSNQSIVLHIGGLFDFEHPSIDHGKQDLQVAQMAIDEINSRHKELFKGFYIFKLLANNTRCDPVYAVDAFFHAIFRRPQLLFLVGTSCSNETKAVIQVADYYNLILFSHSTSFISQANQSYSTLVQLSVSDENYNDARVAFIKYNNWSHVAIIHQDSIEHSLIMAKLAKRLNESNINVILTQSASQFNLTSALQTLREKKARIVFVNFDTLSRPIFFCEVYRTFPKELRERYVWILTENDYHRWNLSIDNCTKQQILEAARGHIIIDSSFEKKSSLLNPNITAQQLQEKFHLKDHLDRQTLHAYDAIWVLALLIHASIEDKISIEKFTYGSMHIRDYWLHLLEKISFLGVSQNMHGYQDLNINCSKCEELVWTGEVPVDKERNETRRVVLNITEIIVINIACLVGLALAGSFLVFNIIYRHERYIKLSSPKLNNVLLIGAMHIHIAILLFGLDQWFLEHHILGHACMLRIFLFSGGFSLTFGSMLLKTLRVYRIFTSNDRPLLHSKLLQDHHLLLICLYIYSIDVLFACVWQFFDPHFTVSTSDSIKHLNIDTIVSNEIYSCDSKYRQKLLPFIYIYKSLFLIIGGYLAAKTRHVHIAALNDSKFIVWSIYTVVLTSLFTFIVMILIQNLRIYVVLAFVVILVTSVIICLVFLPKVLTLKNRHRDEVVSKELYMDKSRTRRLAVEISYYEKYRYAQLQNRELKTELVQLNHTITNLQQRLDSISSNLTIALLPLAVRLASTFLQKPDLHGSNSASPSKSSVGTITPSREEEEEMKSIQNKTMEIEEEPSLISITSSENLYEQFEQTSSSLSSELNLSLVLQSLNNTNSSLSLTTLDDQPDNDDEQNTSETPTQILSDNESVLYLRLANELNIIEATLDSDLDRIG